MLEELVQKPVWSRFSKRVAEKIDNPRQFGRFTEKDAKARKMRLVQGKEGFIEDGNAVVFYWLVDEEDGVIVDAKFQLFGDAALIAAAEGAALLVIGKNYDQARRISAELVDKELRDHPDKPAFPQEAHSYLNLVIGAMDDAVEKCLDLPLPQEYVSPVPNAIEGEGYPGWEELPHKKKLAVIELVIQEDIRPYIELDAGGIEIQELKDFELKIAYQGSCTSCFSAIGATLSTIQEIIAAKVHKDLKVVPDMEALQL